MNTLPLLAAAMLVLATGCIGRETPELEAAAVTDPPAEEAPAEPTPATTAPPAKPTPEPTHTHGAQPNASASMPGAPAPEPAPAPRIDVLAWNGSFTGAGASASTPAGDVCCPGYAVDAPSSDVTFNVPAGLKAIVIELSWADAQMDLDLAALAPDYDATPAPPAPYTGHRYVAAAGAPGQPDAHASIVLTDAEALALVGEWHAVASPKGPANAIAFSLAVSLFYDSAPASDYSALASPSDNP